MRILALLLFLPLVSAGLLPFGIDNAALVPNNGNAYLVGGLDYTGSQDEEVGAFAQSRFREFSSASSYQQLPDLPVPLGLLAAAQTNRGLYTFGGYDKQPTAAIYHYDAGEQMWSQSSTSLEGALYGMSAQAHGGKIYIAGGTNGISINQKIFEFSPASETIREIANFGGLLRSPMPATAWSGEYMYIFGGQMLGDAPGPRVFKFDPVFETVEPMQAQFQTPTLHRMGAASLADGIYLIGGTDRPLTAHQACMACGVNTHIYRYDPNRDAMEIMAGKLDPIAGVAVGAAFGGVFTVGGRGPVGDAESQTKFEVLKPSTGFAHFVQANPGRDPGHVRFTWDSYQDPFSTVRIEQFDGSDFVLVKNKNFMDDEFVHVAQPWDEELRYRITFVDRNGTMQSSAIVDVFARDETPNPVEYDAPDAEFGWEPFYPQACTKTTFTSDPRPAENIVNQTWVVNETVGFGGTFSHTFPGAGMYNVTLSIMDSTNRTDAITHEVRVSAGPLRAENCSFLEEEESPLGFMVPLALVAAVLLARRRS